MKDCVKANGRKRKSNTIVRHQSKILYFTQMSCTINVNKIQGLSQIYTP